MGKETDTYTRAYESGGGWELSMTQTPGLFGRASILRRESDGLRLRYEELKTEPNFCCASQSSLECVINIDSWACYHQLLLYSRSTGRYLESHKLKSMACVPGAQVEVKTWRALISC